MARKQSSTGRKPKAKKTANTTTKKTPSTPADVAHPGPGRPKGATNTPTDVVPVVKSRCAKCDSTNRGEYWGRTVQQFAGTAPDGKPYTHIVRRKCKCLTEGCGQIRIDKTYENRPSSG